MSDADVKEIPGFPADSSYTSESGSRRLIRFIRAIPVMVAAFLIVGAAIYCSTWYFQAANARQAVGQIIENLNKTHPSITYSTIETSGFPFDVNVSIVKPRYVLHQAATPTAPEQNQDTALDGSI